MHRKNQELRRNGNHSQTLETKRLDLFSKDVFRDRLVLHIELEKKRVNHSEKIYPRYPRSEMSGHLPAISNRLLQASLASPNLS